MSNKGNFAVNWPGWVPIQRHAFQRDAFRRGAFQRRMFQKQYNKSGLKK